MDLNDEAIRKITTMVRLMWAMLVVVVSVTTGATVWVTRTDMRLATLERDISSITEGEIANLKVALRRIERSMDRLHGTDAGS